MQISDGRAIIVSTGIRVQPEKQQDNVTVINITVSNVRLRYLSLAISAFYILVTVRTKFFETVTTITTIGPIYFRCRSMYIMRH